MRWLGYPDDSMTLRGLLSVLLLAAACTPASTDVSTTANGEGAASAANDERWPTEFVTGYGTGPALFLSESADAPALGYVSPNVAIETRGAPQNGRLPVRIRGALKVRAWISAERLALRVTEPGKIEGTPAYVGPGDLVRFVSPDAVEGLARVEALPRFADQIFGSGHTGTFAMTALTAGDVPANATPLSTGETFRLPAGQEVPLHATPREVITTLPALEPGTRVEVLRDRGTWKGVRVGEGPYLIGYVNVELADPGEDTVFAAGATGVPSRLRAEADKPLWRLAPDTRIRFDGNTVGILAEAGYGREMNRYEDTQEVDLFVAVNDQVAMRGMVRIADLQPVEAEAPAAAPAAPAAQPAAAQPATP